MTGSTIALWAAVTLVGILLMYVTSRGISAWTKLAAFKQRGEPLVLAALDPFLSRLGPRTEGGHQNLRLRLVRAGFRSVEAPKIFGAARIVASLVGAMLLVLIWLPDSRPMMQMILTAAVLAMAYVGPTAYLDSRASARQAKIGRTLPIVVDLVMLSLEAGLSVEKAFQRIGKEMRSIEPEMAIELRMLVGEVRAGVPFPEAMKRMAMRVGQEDLMMLSGLIAQASLLGTSLSDTFCDFAETSREARMAALEERAGKVSAALTVPLVVCLLPASMLAIVGPAFVLIIKTMGDM